MNSKLYDLMIRGGLDKKCQLIVVVYDRSREFEGVENRREYIGDFIYSYDSLAKKVNESEGKFDSGSNSLITIAFPSISSLGDFTSPVSFEQLSDFYKALNREENF